MRKIAIIGAGGFGREVKTIIDAINKVNPVYDMIGYFDDGIEKGQQLNGLPVLGGILEINTFPGEFSLALCIANPKVKTKILSQITNPKVDYPTLIHPSVMISDDLVKMGQGNIICGGSILTCNIELKDFIILNLCCTVGHDTVIGNYSSFMPSVNISGEVIIHDGVYVGTGAKIINQLEIGAYTTIGAGAVVTKSLPANCTAVGIPARPTLTTGRSTQ